MYVRTVARNCQRAYARYLVVLLLLGPPLADRAAATLIAEEGAAEGGAPTEDTGGPTEVLPESTDEGRGEVVEPVEPAVDTMVQPVEEAPDHLDRFHLVCSDCVHRFADWLDRFFEKRLSSDRDPLVADEDTFFADHEMEESVKLSYVRISPAVRFRESGEADVDVDFSARIRLPRAKRRANIFLQRADAREDLLRNFEGRTSSEDLDNPDSRGSAGVELNLWERSRLRLTGSLGMSFRPDPEPRVKVGLAGHYKLGSWFTKVKQDGFWDSNDGFGERTKLELERHFFEDLFTRGSAEVAWSETTRGVDLSQSLLFYYTFSKRRAMGLKLGVFEHTWPSTVIDEYRVRMPYRQRVWKKWMFVELEPGARFPRDRDYKFTPELVITIDLLAGHIPE